MAKSSIPTSGRKQDPRANIAGILSRDQMRVNRIAEHLERLEKMIEEDPDNPKAAAWEERCAEYRQSLLNFAQFGQETPPGPKAGVKLDVPLGRFGLNKGE